MAAKQYYELKGLDDYFLEDSFVLGIEELGGVVQFYLDLVLREQHPMYQSPRAGEQYCYKRGILSFPECTSVVWSDREGARAFRDASGSVDYGNIDQFVFVDGRYHLSGDWGSVAIESGDPEMTIAE